MQSHTHLARFKQFAAVAKRKTKILDPRKRPKGDGTRPEPVEEPLLTVEDFSKDMDKCKMYVDLKEVRLLIAMHATLQP